MDGKGRSKDWYRCEYGVSDEEPLISTGISHCADFYRTKMNDMSLIYALKVGKCVYLATDSRSTTIHKDENGKITGREYHDYYRKIAKIPNVNIYVAASGINDYDGKTLTEVVSESNSKEDVIDVIGKFNTNLFFFSSENNGIGCSLFGREKRVVSILNEETSHFAAPDRILRIAESVVVPVINDDAVITDFLNDVFCIARLASKWDDQTIGGPVHIMKLVPGKPHVWLQNGYEL